MPTSSLLSAPVEILLLILSHLHPLDILSVRRTCKDLASLTYGREVWQSTLLSVCAMHNTFPSTFPMEEMSPKSLEYAALTPYRFTFSFLKTQYYLSPSSIRVVPPLRELVVDATFGVFEPDEIVPHLVRGGRFLFLVEKSGHTHSIHLIDLGFAPASTIHRIPSAFLKFEGETLHFFMSSVDPRGDMNRIRVFTNVLNASVRTICAYEIRPSSQEPVLSPLKTLTSTEMKLDSTNDIIACRCSRNRLASLIGSTVVIWDFVEGTIVTWEVDDESSYAHIAITDHWLFLFRDNLEFSRWKIPNLVPVEIFSQDGTTAQTIFPDQTCTVTSPSLSNIPPDDARAAGLSVIRTSPRPFRLVYITERPQGDFLSHFDLERPRYPTKTPLELSFLGEASTTQVPRSGYYHGQFCGDAFLLPWLTAGDNKIMVTVSNGFDSPSSHFNKVVRLSEGSARSVLDFDYCPVAARFCVITDGGEIRILDF